MEWFYERRGQAEGPHTLETIQRALSEGELSSNTLVWRDGMEDWQPVHGQPEFAALISRRPPPLPVRESALEAPFNSAAAASPAVGPAEAAIADKRTILSEGVPWSRYFARQIDLTVLGFTLGLGLSYGLPFISMPAYIAFVGANESVLGILLVAGAFVMNACIISIFGNSIGKHVFRLKAEPVDARGNKVAWVFRREFRVWLYGAGLGIPIIGLFTAILNYIEVKKGRPARYDRNFARMAARHTGGIRRAFGILLAVSLIGSLVAFGVWAEATTTEAYRSRPWSNPVTDQVVMVPAGWAHDATAADDGSDLQAFSRMDQSEVIYLAAEVIPGGSFSLTRYAHAIEQSLADTVTMTGSWQQETAGGRVMLRRDGYSQSDGFPSSYLVWKDGERFWRIVGVRLTGSTPPELLTMPIVEALVQSTGD